MQSKTSENMFSNITKLEEKMQLKQARQLAKLQAMQEAKALAT